LTNQQARGGRSKEANAMREERRAAKHVEVWFKDSTYPSRKAAVGMGPSVETAEYMSLPAWSGEGDPPDPLMKREQMWYAAVCFRQQMSGVPVDQYIDIPRVDNHNICVMPDTVDAAGVHCDPTWLVYDPDSGALLSKADITNVEERFHNHEIDAQACILHEQSVIRARRGKGKGRGKQQ